MTYLTLDAQRLTRNTQRLRKYADDYLKFAASQNLKPSQLEFGRDFFSWMIEIIARYDLETGRATSEDELLKAFQQCMRTRTIEPAEMIALLEEVRG